MHFYKVYLFWWLKYSDETVYSDYIIALIKIGGIFVDFSLYKCSKWRHSYIAYFMVLVLQLLLCLRQYFATPTSLFKMKLKQKRLKSNRKWRQRMVQIERDISKGVKKSVCVYELLLCVLAWKCVAAISHSM